MEQHEYVIINSKPILIYDMSLAGIFYENSMLNKIGQAEFFTNMQHVESASMCIHNNKILSKSIIDVF